MSVPVLYRIHPVSPESHLFNIILVVDQPAQQGQVFRLPSWIPGSYMIREFARHIVTMQAEAAGQPVAIRKLDKDSWQAEPVAGPLTLRYQVYAFDLSVRGAYLDNTRGFFNGTSVFLAVEGAEWTRCEVDIEPPAGKAQRDWQLATSLRRKGNQHGENGFGRYQADNHDELIDHPVEMGCFTQVSFKACGVPHQFVIAGRARCDLKRLARDVKKICEWHINLFGQPAPFDRYLFLLFVGKDSYGGLEHRNSTALMAERDDLPMQGDPGLSDGYVRLLGLISHEYFHAWNVKRMKPAVFQPYQLNRENHTRLLWAFEGVTSYYDDLALLRVGLIDRERYLGLLAETITGVMRANGRTKQSLEDSSFDAWIKHYRQDENSPNSLISYYTKGSLVALCLDLLIRQQTGQAKSLDDVMRTIWRKWLEDGLGVAEDGWERLATEATGLDLQAFFDLALRSTKPLPLESLLASQGISLAMCQASGPADRGSVASESRPAGLPRLTLGIKTASEAAGVRIQQVFDGGAAQAAGLSGGDLIVAIDGLRAMDPEKMLARLTAGKRVRLHAFRRDELQVVDVVPQVAARDTCRLCLTEAPGPWPGC